MKIKILICAFVLFTNVMQAQTTPETFLGLAPSVPSNICSTKSDQKKTFLENNSVFADKLKVEIERRKKASKEYLDKNSGKIKAGTLKGIADILNEVPDVKVKIVGHTDADGDDAKNMELSKGRAASVKAELVKSFGVNADRLITDGMGETKPVAPNDTPANKAQNRRVEFIKL